MTVAIIGIGNVGRTLGQRVLAGGDAVVFGVRDPKAGVDVPAGARVAAASDAVSGADVVIFAVPAGALVDAAKGAGNLSGKVVIDCTNPLRFDSAGPVWAPPPEGSATQALAAALPGLAVVKGFNHFGVEIHADPNVAGRRVDALFAGDDSGAKRTAMALAERMGFHGVDAGPLRNAGALEHLAVLWIQLAMSGSAGRHFAFQIIGRA